MRTGAHIIATLLGGAALTACQPYAAKPVQKAEAHDAPASTPAALKVATADAPLHDWLVGS
ncbi:MAG TPA: hypothetical protein VN029_13895, partial [Sphingomonas sp.]|nr:hypothetical protein [Sphingomonas sp.]